MRRTHGTRVSAYGMELSQMIVIGETFVNYGLLKDIEGAVKAGVIKKGIDNEDESRHVSELERRLSALDDKETYIAIKTLIKHHKKTVLKTLEYMEGKSNETDQRV